MVFSESRISRREKVIYPVAFNYRKGSTHAIEKVLSSPSPSGRGVGVTANVPPATVPAKPNQFALKRRYSGNEPPESLVDSGCGRF